MKRKTFPLVEVKTDTEAGTFQALASVFGNVDHVGDRMLPGSFEKTLENWRSSGDPIPVILSHQWSDPFAMIGKADPRAVYEDERGLVVQGQLDLTNDVAVQVHKLMSERLLKGWSFGYTVPKGGQKMKNGVNEVNQVDLIEVGPTLVGANDEAHLETVKTLLHEQVEPVVYLKADGTIDHVEGAVRVEELSDPDGKREEPQGQATPVDPELAAIRQMVHDNLTQNGADNAQP